MCSISVILAGNSSWHAPHLTTAQICDNMFLAEPNLVQAVQEDLSVKNKNEGPRKAFHSSKRTTRRKKNTARNVG
jgi:hypothetical protein